MSRKILIVLNICLILVFGNCQVVENGQCDVKIETVTNFRIHKFMGRWNLIQSYTSESQSGTCNDATYTLSESKVDVINTQVINQALVTINGTAVMASSGGSAKLLINFPSTRELSDYWILATDYDSYALVYSCQNLNSEQKRVWSWKLSRTNELSEESTIMINEIVNSTPDLDKSYYYTVDKSDSGCFYYPEPNGEPVVFRGQCDETIPVVSNFDVERYLGVWYDVESYPTDFQLGSCPTATYTLGSEGVIVYNTEIVDGHLNYIYGSAVLETENGDAKLIVSFPIPGTNHTTSANYWVLATDYDTYALVYSCRNIDQEYHRVGAWKLSRLRKLPASADEAINEVIKGRPELHQQYFLHRAQSVYCDEITEDFSDPKRKK